MKGIELNPQLDPLERPETFVNHVQALIGEENKADWGTLLQEARVFPTEEIKPPQIAWRQVTGIGTEAILGTLGNISLIIGKAKSRKSFFVNIAVSAVLGDDLLLDQFSGALPDGKKTVLYFDTEQSRYHVQLALKRICRQIKIDAPPNLQVYGLRKYNPMERLAAIEEAIETIPGIGFVVIDGIKDLVTSINDEEQATIISSKLLKWSEERGIHILSVLHQNKSDTNARGHIGTELINKSETVLSVTKSPRDKDISIVEAEFCRNIEPDPFAFEIIDGLPQLVNDFEIRVEVPKKIDLTELSSPAKYEILNVVYSYGDSFGYGDLARQVKLAFKEKYDKSIGDNQSKDFITDCKNRGWLQQEKERKPYFQGEFDPIGLS